jgi:hypothetical protein
MAGCMWGGWRPALFDHHDYVHHHDDHDDRTSNDDNHDDQACGHHHDHDDHQATHHYHDDDHHQAARHYHDDNDDCGSGELFGHGLSTDGFLQWLSHCSRALLGLADRIHMGVQPEREQQPE